MTIPALRLWPLDPLFEATGLTAHQLSHRVGASGSTIVAAQAEGLTDCQADRWAIRLGQHPRAFWPDWDRYGQEVAA